VIKEKKSLGTKVKELFTGKSNEEKDLHLREKEVKFL